MRASLDGQYHNPRPQEGKLRYRGIINDTLRVGLTRTESIRTCGGQCLVKNKLTAVIDNLGR